MGREIVFTDPEANALKPNDAGELQAEGISAIVVDDNVDAADLLGLHLTLLGADVRVTYDGRRGLELALEAIPNVIFHDLSMPEFSGWEAARVFRGDRRFDRVVLVAVTALATAQDRERTREIGFDFHFAKPVTPDQLQQVLASVRAPRP